METACEARKVKLESDMLEHWVVPLRLVSSHSNSTNPGGAEPGLHPETGLKSMSSKISNTSNSQHKWKRKPKSDDWNEVTDHEERRRIQNRIAQRKFREKAREQKERAEREQKNQDRAGGSYTIPQPGDISLDEDTSGLPWGSFNIRYIFPSRCVAEVQIPKSADSRYPYTHDDNQGQHGSHGGNDYQLEGPYYYDYDILNDSTGRIMDSCRRESDSAYGSASSFGVHIATVPGHVATQEMCPTPPLGDSVEVAFGQVSLEESRDPEVPRRGDPPKLMPDGKLSDRYHAERLESSTPTAEAILGSGKDIEGDTSGSSDSTSTLGSPSSSLNDSEGPTPLHTTARARAIADMIDRVMEKFWILYGHGCDMVPPVDSPGDSNVPGYERPVATVEQRHPPHQTQRKAVKRERDNDDDAPNDDDEDNRRQRYPNAGSEPHNGEPVRFSCLFRKHDPSVFSIHTHKICALSPWPSIARLKEHLYRAHKTSPHCKRCWQVFESEAELDEHIVVPAAKICEARPGKSPAGITPDHVNQLRSRKKSSRNQTDEDRWREMYRLIFPGDAVPSPYFEPPLDQCGLSPDSRDLLEYESFLRREMPRLVRSSLEQQARIEIQPLEQALIESLPRIIQDCQESAFRAYRQQKRGSSVNSQHTAIRDSVSVEPAEKSKTATSEDQAEAVSSILDSAYQPPPAQEPGLAEGPDVLWARPEGDAPSDSGYGSICNCVGSCTCCWWENLFDNSDFPG